MLDRSVEGLDFRLKLEDLVDERKVGDGRSELPEQLLTSLRSVLFTPA